MAIGVYLTAMSTSPYTRTLGASEGRAAAMVTRPPRREKARCRRGVEERGKPTLKPETDEGVPAARAARRMKLWMSGARAVDRDMR